VSRSRCWSVGERRRPELEESVPIVGEEGLFAAAETTAFKQRFSPMAEDCGGTEVGMWGSHYHHCCQINPAHNGDGEIETNDLHVNVESSAATKGPNGNDPPSATSFGTGKITNGGKTLEFEEETMEKRGWVSVCWWSSQERDRIAPNDSGKWTKNGNAVADVDVNNCD